MNIDETKKYITANKQKFPLSYQNDLVFKANEEQTKNKYVVGGEQKNCGYLIHPFYKRISRF